MSRAHIQRRSETRKLPIRPPPTPDETANAVSFGDHIQQSHGRTVRRGQLHLLSIPSIEMINLFMLADLCQFLLIFNDTAPVVLGVRSAFLAAGFILYIVCRLSSVEVQDKITFLAFTALAIFRASLEDLLLNRVNGLLRSVPLGPIAPGPADEPAFRYRMQQPWIFIGLFLLTGVDLRWIIRVCVLGLALYAVQTAHYTGNYWQGWARDYPIFVAYLIAGSAVYYTFYNQATMISQYRRYPQAGLEALRARKLREAEVEVLERLPLTFLQRNLTPEDHLCILLRTGQNRRHRALLFYLLGEPDFSGSPEQRIYRRLERQMARHQLLELTLNEMEKASETRVREVAKAIKKEVVRLQSLPLATRALLDHEINLLHSLPKFTSGSERILDTDELTAGGTFARGESGDSLHRRKTRKIGENALHQVAMLKSSSSSPLGSCFKDYYVWHCRIRTTMHQGAWYRYPAMPRRNLLGEFVDEKIHRWFLAWLCYVQVDQYRKSMPVMVTALSLQLVLALVVGGVEARLRDRRISISWFYGYLGLRSLALAVIIAFVIKQITLKKASSCQILKRRMAIFSLLGLLIPAIDYMLWPAFFESSQGVYPFLVLLAGVTFPLHAQLTTRVQLILQGPIWLLMMATAFVGSLSDGAAWDNLARSLFLSVGLVLWNAFISRGLMLNYSLLFARYTLPYLLYIDALRPTQSSFGPSTVSFIT